MASTAGRFSNEFIRPQADRMAQAYYFGDRVKDRWTALGSGQAALDELRHVIHEAAVRIATAFQQNQTVQSHWTGSSSPVPNDGTTLDDGQSQAITGAQAVNVINRGIEFRQWLDTGLFAGGGGGGGAHRNTIYEVVFMLAADITLTEAGNVINRIGELQTEYEASANSKLNTILAVSIGPDDKQPSLP